MPMPDISYENRELLKMYLMDNFSDVEEMADWVAHVALIDDDQVDALLDAFLEMEEELTEMVPVVEGDIPV